MDTRWYVIRAVNGKEKEAKENFEAELKGSSLDKYVKQVLIPWEKVAYLRKGKKVSMQKNHYPGYILAEIDKNSIGELTNMFRNINYVAGFLGDKNPQPLRNSEVKDILGKMDDLMMADEQMADKYILGETVKINDGPFKTFIGKVSEIMDDKKRIKVCVKVFGRDTELELEYLQVDKEIA